MKMIEDDYDSMRDDSKAEIMKYEDELDLNIEVLIYYNKYFI
jgi:hypothetical protein